MYSHAHAIPNQSTFLFHQTPVLETPDGAVFESNAIARYGMSA